jgi:hypothetical protein
LVLVTLVMPPLKAVIFVLVTLVVVTPPEIMALPMTCKVAAGERVPRPSRPVAVKTELILPLLSQSSKTFAT